MKKLISIILSLALIGISTVTAFAAQNADNSTSEADPRIGNYKFLETVQIPNNHVYIYTYGDNSDTSRAIQFEECDSDFTYTHHFSKSSTRFDLPLTSDSGYKAWIMFEHKNSSTAGLYNSILDFRNTGGTYQKVRIKLSAFSSYFNEDGTVTTNFSGKPQHNYNFTDEGDGHRSELIFISGGAITAVAPDKNGYVEIYVSTNIGEQTAFTTNFEENSAGGGGTSGRAILGFTIGDTSNDGYISIMDVTLIQKYIVKQESFDELQLRNADTDFDGTIDIADATKIQKVLAKIDY
jgi:hypothetical protein